MLLARRECSSLVIRAEEGLEHLSAVFGFPLPPCSHPLGHSAAGQPAFSTVWAFGANFKAKAGSDMHRFAIGQNR